MFQIGMPRGGMILEIEPCVEMQLIIHQNESFACFTYFEPKYINKKRLNELPVKNDDFPLDFNQLNGIRILKFKLQFYPREKQNQMVKI